MNGETVDADGIVTQVTLTADEDNRQAFTVVTHFVDPLGANIVERFGRVDGEANEDDVRFRVGKRSETVVIFLAYEKQTITSNINHLFGLTGRVPQGQVYRFPVNVDLRNVIFKNRRHICLRKR